MKMKNILLAILFATGLSSCSVGLPLQVTDNSVGTKVGKASYSVILGFIRPMDADIGIAQAAENGRIEKVATVDFHIKAGIFKTTYTTVVTGE
ncbi:MAG: TRL domain-containing protein [Bacteroidia bacterium]